MPKITINNKEIEFENGMTVLQACELAGAEIPRFCYHERLSIAGNCRMCLVEMEKSSKPIASCAMPATEGMKIKTNTRMVEKARKGVMEFLLTNHPLDCPVCDQGGECDLQDQSLYYGFDKSRFKENKRQVKDKYMGPLIKTIMNRCIHCTRCIRFATEVGGVTEIGATGRGENMEITTYLEKTMESELSANVIDLCPVGALTSKPYAFEARPWELKKTETIDVMDAVGSNIRVDTYGWEVKRILPRLNNDINEEWISDKTRYACDGLLKQRLDKPYKKENGKLLETDWDDVINIVSSKINQTDDDKIGAHVGDLQSIETITAFKSFLDSNGIKNYDFREKPFYINPKNKINYIFNSSIKGIEETDCIVLIGTNPRHEATMVNARIRKSFMSKKMPIYSFGNPGDLTYDYKVIGDRTEDIKKFINNETQESKIFLKAKKPIIIIGESALENESGQYIFESIKKFLSDNNFINDEWNALNILLQNASTVGAIDVEFFDKNLNNFNFFEKLKNHEFDLLYLLGSDNLDFTKTNEFIIYQGSHGDRGAQIADIILPGAAFTEQSGHYTNLEGKIQKAYKASYPPGDAKEDWQVINDLAEIINNRKLFNDKDELESSMFNYLKIKQEQLTSDHNYKKNDDNFVNEILDIKFKDYYFSNVIARSSKTMLECNNSKLDFKKTGTEG